MKGDYSRSTLDPKDNVHAVMYQQGRPLDDASLNEASAVTLRRIETEALDVIGATGAPLHGGGFRIVKDATQLTKEESEDPRNKAIPGTPPFLLTAGRFYVDGVQVENHALCAVTAQPHPPQPPLPELAYDGRKLMYLKATIDHRTGLELPRLLDPAFGDADTTARTLVVWQVRALPVKPNVECGTGIDEWTALTAPLTGRIQATVDKAPAATDPCKLTAGAGYTRPENLLYRVEVDGGTPTLTVDGEDRLPRDGLVVKLSRNNAAEVARVVEVDGNEIVVEPGSRDGRPVFQKGEYLEVLDPDDDTDLGTQLGWVRIEKVDGERIELAAGHNVEKPYRVRLWSTDRQTLNASNGFTATLDGIRFAFLDGTYRRGTYFLVPARYAIGDVMSGGELAPAGPRVHYGRLGLVDIQAGVVQKIVDCRPVFEPLTEQLTFQYVGGDGQDALPGATLPQPLSVRAALGRFPLAGARVRFTVETGEGGIVGAPAGQPLDVDTDDEGIASCGWTLDANPRADARSQTLFARLLDMTTPTQPVPRPGCIVRFAATASATIVQHCGDGQEAPAGTALEQPIAVRIANGQSPLAGATVAFAVVDGGGTITTAAPIVTDADGIARATWQLGPAGPQRVEARWLDGTGTVVQTVAFGALLRVDGGGGCAVTIGEGGDLPGLDSATLKRLLDEHRGHLCICFLAGRHRIEELQADGNDGRLSIHGCGRASVLELIGPVRFRDFAAIDIDDVAIRAARAAGFQFLDVDSVALSGWSARMEEEVRRPFLRFARVASVTIAHCTVEMQLPGICAVFEDDAALVDITGCELHGLVSFYGPPAGTVPLPELPVGPLRARLTKWTLVTPGRGRLRLSSNRFDALAIGRRGIDMLNRFANGEIPGLSEVFADALLVGNSFGFATSQLLASRISLSGNAFMGEPFGTSTAATFVAGNAVAAGNVGELPQDDGYMVVLVTPGGMSEEAANGVWVQISP